VSSYRAGLPPVWLPIHAVVVAVGTVVAVALLVHPNLVLRRGDVIRLPHVLRAILVAAVILVLNLIAILVLVSVLVAIPVLVAIASLVAGVVIRAVISDSRRARVVVRAQHVLDDVPCRVLTGAVVDSDGGLRRRLPVGRAGEHHPGARHRADRANDRDQPGSQQQ
jgi:hypothetical protein